MIHSLLPLLTVALQEGAAPASEASPGSDLSDLLVPMLVIIGIFYVVLILPERKKQKQRTEMLDAMKKGDKVMTSAGIYGTVAQAQDDVVTLQVADGVRIRFNRAAIQSVLDADGKEKTADSKED